MNFFAGTTVWETVVCRIRKAERVPSQQTWSRAADTTKIFDEKFLVAEESFLPGAQN